MLRTFTDYDWLENFRMSRATFQYLCTQLRPAIERRDTRLRRAITVEHRVAITLWCLATPAEYRTIAHLFGIARSTVCEITHETVDAIVMKLKGQYITFPTGEAQREVINGFESKWGFPQCVGAIDGSHIPVRAPLLNHTDYYNRKGWYSILVQAVVDHRYLFRNVNVGWPGSVHDARVFVNSAVYAEATSKQILQGDTRQILGQDVPVFLIGDSAYPLLSWLLKPFADSTALTPEQKHFNYRLSRARIVVENAFGRLKARWRRLLKQNDMEVRNVPNVVTACCVLHNVCEIHGEAFDNNWVQEAERMSHLSQPTATPHHDGADEGNPQAIRDTLVRYLSA